MILPYEKRADYYLGSPLRRIVILLKRYLRDKFY